MHINCVKVAISTCVKFIRWKRMSCIPACWMILPLWSKGTPADEQPSWIQLVVQTEINHSSWRITLILPVSMGKIRSIKRCFTTTTLRLQSTSQRRCISRLDCKKCAVWFCTECIIQCESAVCLCTMSNWERETENIPKIPEYKIVTSSVYELTAGETSRVNFA